jgi:hypothetical protein
MSSDRLLGDRDGVFNTCNPRGFLSDLLRGLPHEAGAHFAGQVHDVIKGLNIDGIDALQVRVTVQSLLYIGGYFGVPWATATPAFPFRGTSQKAPGQ